MRRRWARPLVIAGLAAGLLGGAGILLLPDGPAPRKTAVTTSTTSTTQDLDSAVRRGEAHLTRVPGDWPAWAALGMTRLELARITAHPAHLPLAETAFRRSLEVRPTGNAPALTGLGALAAARHEFRDALRYARRAVAADAWSADAYGVLTDANTELGRYPQARAAAIRMTELRPGTGSLGRLSYLAELAGDTGRAKSLMRRALDLAVSPGETAFALTHLGDLAFGSGELGAAAGCYARGLQHSPGSPALLAGRARVDAARGDRDAAITGYRAAVAVLPTADHLTALSDVLAAAGRTAEAAEADALVRAGAGLPGAAADLDLVLFHADRGEAATAVREGRALLAARPAAPVETAYAWALHAAGRHREALTHADRGLRPGTRDARAHYQRGLIREALGDRAGARADLTEALALNPYFSVRHAPAARAALDRLGGPA